MPTAQQLLTEVQRTLSNTLTSFAPLPPGLGVEATDHLVPFQCSAWVKSVSLGPLKAPSSPAAQQLLAPVHQTSRSSLTLLLVVPPGAGVVTTDHLVPFQCSASFSSGPPLS